MNNINEILSEEEMLFAEHYNKLRENEMLNNCLHVLPDYYKKDISI